MSSQRHILVVADCVPHRLHGGAGVTSYTMARALSEQGCRVTVLALEKSQLNGNLTEQDHIAHLRELGIACRILPEREDAEPVPRNGRWKKYYRDLFPGFRHRRHAARAVAEIAPDVLCMYHWDAVAACFDVREVPKVGLVGDPAHLPILLRRHFTGRLEGRLPDWRERLDQFLLARALKQGMVDLLASCQETGAFAAQHAAMLRRLGAARCRYMRSPTPMPLGRPMGEPDSRRPRILHVGHLRGIATLVGVEFLIDRIVPHLDRIFGREGYDIHMVGGLVETLPASLRAKLKHPAIILRGHVPDIDAEFAVSHFLLVPIPIPLGMRIRILTAFSMECAVIAHKINLVGLPEMRDGESCLLGSTGRSLAEACRRVFADEEFRKALARNGRRLYETYFAPIPAGAAIRDLLEEAITAWELAHGGSITAGVQRPRSTTHQGNE